jgi:hypothetical protein
MNRPWPEDRSKTVVFDELSDPLRKAFRSLYSMRRKANGTDWTGLDIGRSLKAGCTSPDDNLSKEGLAYHREQGRDALDALIQVALQTGMEQGERMLRERQKTMVMLLKILAKDSKNRDSILQAIECLEES